MIGKQIIFLLLRKEKGGNVTFGNDSSTKKIRKGIVNLGNERSKQDNVLLIENMKHTLPIVTQLYDQGHALAFDSKKCEIRSEKSGRLVATTFRTPNNIYILQEMNGEKCCIG